MQRFFTKRNIVLSTILLVFLLVLTWFYNHSYISVSLPEGGGEYSITITDQSSNSSSVSKTSSNNFKKLVGRGSFEVHIQKDGQDYLRVTKTSGWLRTTVVAAELSPEHARSFVGKNPSSCMYLVGGRLASSPCVGNVDGLELHLPATSSMPTITQKVAGPSGRLEGFVSRGDSALAVVRAESELSPGIFEHLSYVVGSDGIFKTETAKVLKGLEGTSNYRVVGLPEGFLAYEDGGDEVLHFSNSEDEPGRTTLTAPKTTKAGLRFASRSDETIVAVFSTALSDYIQAEGSHGEELEVERQTAPSQIQLIKGSEVRSLDIKAEVLKARLCGDQKLCVLTSEGEVNIYDASVNKLPLLYRLTGARDIGNSPDQAHLQVVLNDAVYNFNLEDASGYSLYSFADYGYCGLGQLGAESILCISDQNGNHDALALSGDAEGNDNIDKKILELSELKQIKSLSVYGSFIYVSPELGQIEFRESTGGFGYDPAVIQSTADAINKKVLDLGIDTAKYKVINPYKPN